VKKKMLKLELKNQKNIKILLMLNGILFMKNFKKFMIAVFLYLIIGAKIVLSKLPIGDLAT
jgi:hypothetical protein